MLTTLPQSPGFWRHGLLLSCLASPSAVVTGDDGLLAPMASRNLSPLYANLGIPVMDSAVPLSGGEIHLDWTLHWASHAVIEGAATETLQLDGETRRQDFRARLGLGKGLVMSLSIPYVQHSAGQLDGLIDGWHAFWGMPDGPRAVQPEDKLRFVYTGNPGFDLQSHRSGLGDAELGISVALATTEQWALGLYGQYKFATGNVDDFTGSGQDSLALGARFSAVQCFFARLSCHAQAGFAAVNDSEFDPLAETVTPFVGLSLAWQLGDSLALLAQVDAHGVIYDADVLSANGAPVWGTLGLRWQPVERWLLDAQFVEDLAVGSAPDVSFRFALSRSF